MKFIRTALNNTFSQYFVFFLMVNYLIMQGWHFRGILPKILFTVFPALLFSLILQILPLKRNTPPIVAARIVIIAAMYLIYISCITNLSISDFVELVMR